MSTMTPIPQNYKRNVDWILGAYTDAGVTFVNGFQKDAIQNAVGARRSSKWKNWTCDISLVENEHGSFVVVEDSGTVGLIGRNIPAQQINDMMDREEKLPCTERLARFTSMFNSGGNITGGGLFGAGKSVYSVASTSYTYFFDSLREDKKYVANINKSGRVMSVALEGEEAKEYILEQTGLSAKETVGTRIIIDKPRAELVDAIKDGSIIPYIQESWWLIIEKFDSTSWISVNGVPVSIPDDIKEGKHVYDLPSPELYQPDYRVKNFGVYVFEKGENRWCGFSYYRKGMKIGEIDLTDIPEKISGCYWGYIEVDGLWEDALAEIEDKVHFGVSKGKKHTTTYQMLKNYCDSKFKQLLLEWGYIKDAEHEDKKLHDELQQIAEDLQDLFDKLGFEDLGKGPQKSDFDVRWQDIVFPTPGSETVTTGDALRFSMRIKSAYASEKKFDYKLYVVNPKSGVVISLLDQGATRISPGSVFKKEYVHSISSDNSEQYVENRIVLVVKAVGSANEKKKEISYFYDTSRPDNAREAVTLTLHECIFPRPGSRRVNFGESLKGIRYRIDNKRNIELKYRLNISIHNASDKTCPKIVDIGFLEGVVKPYEEEITTPLDDIVFVREVYEQHMASGKLELRARLIANEEDEEFEKGERITYFHYGIFLNCDEKNGKNDAFDIKSVDDPGNYKRSWFTPGIGRTIFLNIGHTAYLNVKDSPDTQHEYMREQMLKQYVLLYLAEGKYGMFGAQFADLEPQEAAECVLEKIERVYWNSLK